MASSTGVGTVTGTTLLTDGTLDLNGKAFIANAGIVTGTAVMTNAIAGASYTGPLSNAATVGLTAEGICMVGVGVVVTLGVTSV